MAKEAIPGLLPRSESVATGGAPKIAPELLTLIKRTWSAYYLPEAA